MNTGNPHLHQVPDSGQGHPVLHTQDDRPWFLVHSKPRQEHLALEQLQAQGYHAWMPMLKRLTPARRQRTVGPFTWEPVFPRYVFFRPGHPGQSIAPARSTVGVTRLVSFGHVPAQMPHGRLCELALWERQQHQLDAAAVAGLQPGMVVRITDGPLAGLDALVQLPQQDRVVVLLQLLGKSHAVSLPVQSVLPVG
jgi:transcriptional antiterminator RfaH